MQEPHNLEPFDKRSSWTTNDAYVVSTIAESETMIAWKRVYIEQDNMYKLGATITVNAAAGATKLVVDNCADFNVGDSVVVFWPNGTHNATITGKADPSPVYRIFLTERGSDYTEVPNINIEGGGGTGATATAIVGGLSERLTSIQLDSGGEGYTKGKGVGPYI